jgi:hypothetical protein
VTKGCCKSTDTSGPRLISRHIAIGLPSNRWRSLLSHASSSSGVCLTVQVSILSVRCGAKLHPGLERDLASVARSKLDASPGQSSRSFT